MTVINGLNGKGVAMTQQWANQNSHEQINRMVDMAKGGDYANLCNELGRKSAADLVHKYSKKAREIIPEDLLETIDRREFVQRAMDDGLMVVISGGRGPIMAL